jgi:maltose alpha-D-glucosyltransferase/alpha-amylase
LVELLKGRGRKLLAEAVEDFLVGARWFSKTAGAVQRIEILDAIHLNATATDEDPAAESLCLIIAVFHAAGEPDTYVLPLSLYDEPATELLSQSHQSAGVLRVVSPDGVSFVLCDATWQNDFWRDLLKLLRTQGKVSGSSGALVGVSTSACERLWTDDLLSVVPQVQLGQQTNTSANIANRLNLKLIRRVSPGMNPDFEIGRALTERGGLAHVPQLAGAIEYQDAAGRNLTVAIAHEWIENAGDAWSYTLDELGRFFEQVQTRTADEPQPTPEHSAGFFTVGSAAVPGDSSPSADTSPSKVPLAPAEWMKLEPSLSAQETVGAYLHSAEQLGLRLGQLHVALASIDDDPAFKPEPFSKLYQRGLYQSMRTQTRQTLGLLRDRFHHLADDARDVASQLLQMESVVFERFADLMNLQFNAERIRCHGDFHLGQILVTGKEFVIIDFEGEPERPVSERRIKSSPLRDVAGMIRSFDYVVSAALRGHASTLLVENAAAVNQGWAAFWYGWTTSAFLRAYLAEARTSSFLPTDDGQLARLLTAFVLERALFELRDELHHRPDWVDVPIKGILQLIS